MASLRRLVEPGPLWGRGRGRGSSRLSGWGLQAAELLSGCCFLSGCRPPGSGDQGATEEARPQPAIAVWKDIHRPHADGGVDQEDRLEPAKDPALPEPHAAPGLFGPALLSAGGTGCPCRPPGCLSAVHLPDFTSLGLCMLRPSWVCHLFPRSPVLWDLDYVAVASWDEQILALLELCALKASGVPLAKKRRDSSCRQRGLVGRHWSLRVALEA